VVSWQSIIIGTRQQHALAKRVRLVML